MNSDSDKKYGRILLKLSGEILAGSQTFGIDPQAFNFVCGEIKEINQINIETAIVIGGGNIFRGLNASQNGMDRVNADNMGMLATVINALALKDRLEDIGVPARVMSGIRIDAFVENYVRDKAIRHLQKGRVVILCAGTGRPFFSTDTAASLRAAELKADIIIKATKVDGVYSDDPVKNPKAELFKSLSHMDVVAKNLKVMDLTSITMCRENNIPICVFNMHTPGNLKKVVAGKPIGTIIS
ncbi:MAG: UMP kinase [Candidatus Zixiibacteriota bacterium]